MIARKRETLAPDEESQRFLDVDGSDARHGRKGKPRRMSLLATLYRGASQCFIRAVYVAVAILFAYLLVNALSSESEHGGVDTLEPGFHVVLYGAPNRTSTSNLCRSILTSAALEFPPPTFVNSTRDLRRGWRSWPKQYKDNETVARDTGFSTPISEEAPAEYSRRTVLDPAATHESLDVADPLTDRNAYATAVHTHDLDELVFPHIEQRNRLEAVQNALWQITARGGADSDIVLVVDAYDSILQLPADLLLKRYHALNKDASRHGSKQTVAFAASKMCALEDPSAPACTIQSWHSLPQKEMYAGIEVEKPVYLHPGFFIGPIADLQQIFERAQQYMTSADFVQHATYPMNDDYDEYEYGRTHSDDDVAKVLSQIYAEQQLFREIKQSRDVTWWNLASMHIPFIFRPGKSSTTANNTHFGLLPSRKYDFHIGLDHGSSIVHLSESASSSDACFINFSNPPAKSTLASTTLGCTFQPLRLPPDLGKADGPFSSLQHGGKDPFGTASNALVSGGWANVELYTNLCTGSVPAVILYVNGPTNQFVNSGRREEEWRLLWLHAHSQQFLDNQVWRAEHTTAEVVSGSLIVGLSSIAGKAGVQRIDMLKGDVNVGNIWLEENWNMTKWDELCEPVREGVF